MSDLSRYFDVNATTPMSAVSRSAWLDANERFWQNPSSLYREAGMAKQELEVCREEVADRLGLDEPERVIFTSGATEANNAMIRYVAATREGKLLMSSIEHPCVEAAVLAMFGDERTEEVAVDPGSGVIDVDRVRKLLERGGIAAVSVMAANNETGTLQPWEELAALAHEFEVPFHSDAAQWIGKLPAAKLGTCDFLTGSAHKFGGGKGIGFMVIPEDAEDFHSLIGGPQEDGRRAGTENLPAVMAMVAALEECEDGLLRDVSSKGRDAFEARMKNEGMSIVGEAGPRLWNTSMLILPHTKNLKWLIRLSQRGFSVSTGSACSAGRGNPSRVMTAMGLDFDEMSRVMRFSGGTNSSEKDWLSLADALSDVEAELRQ
ncbi:MAG: aminotransferase class V-fold PLP-dependent enzyme [Verrucomicrobiales bacterium]|nr:aminotransferase class V-fold PLP-dependent enzyme [Verrucomicrobiales bacterium]